MKICLMCDLHLPFDRNALQYRILEWAIFDILEKKPDCVVFCGDATCDGNEDAYDFFIQAVEKTGLPFLYIPGNSDLRSLESKGRICQKASKCKHTINGVSIYAVNDCDGEISKEQLKLLADAEDGSIVFMHHPLDSHKQSTTDQLLRWREDHKGTTVFYGHLHRSFSHENSVSLPTMDPDKSIGEPPCITYYDTAIGETCKSHASASVPTDLSPYFGISCYDPIRQLRFAIDKKLKYIELRPNCLAYDLNEIKSLIDLWRKNGGEGLSIHLSDVAWRDGCPCTDEKYDRLIELVSVLHADRVTQHVPRVSAKEIAADATVLEKICAYIAERLNRVPHSIVVGVENMHMTKNESADDNRRFGYIPEECIAYMQTLAGLCRHRVGVNFDIGHARNNLPYSKKYQISTWFSMLGKDIVGYHIHQVTFENGVLQNHMPIQEVYGELISFASFFQCWSMGLINKAPVVFEMRSENAYEITLETFDRALS